MLKNKRHGNRIHLQAIELCIMVMFYMMVLCGGVVLYQQTFVLAQTTEAVTDTALFINTLPITALQKGQMIKEQEDKSSDVVNGLTYIKNANKLKVLEKTVKKRKASWKAERARLRAIRKEKRRLARMKKLCGVVVDRKEQAVLERIVEAEAGGEDMKGRILVANVVLNRVKSGKFPSTITKVVFAHRGNRYQFSPLYDGRYYTVRVSDTTKKAVKRALHGEDPSRGALYFMARRYASASSVRWFDSALTKVTSHGCHEFFK